MSLCRHMELQKTGIPSIPSGLVVGRGDTGKHKQTGCGHMSGRARRMERERRRGTETGSTGQEILRESRKGQGWAGRPWAPRLTP